eukprot:Hpha_TRINITY_DN3734_c0_g1::TRINITY_DN3734_c0_g1_i1::g.23889::m.23889
MAAELDVERLRANGLRGELEDHLRGGWRRATEEDKELLFTREEKRVGGRMPLYAETPAWETCHLREGEALKRLPEPYVWDVPGSPWSKRPRGIDRLWEVAQGRRVCVAGDSVGYQLYKTLNALVTRAGYEAERVLTAVRPDLLPGTRWKPAFKIAWDKLRSRGISTAGLLTQIPEIRYAPPGHSGKRVSFKYIRFFLWKPSDIEFLEDCDVLVIGFDLHYQLNLATPGSGMLSRKLDLYRDDVRHALAWLVNWTRSVPGRVAVWKEALPQHFRHTPEGVYLFANRDRLGCVHHQVKQSEQIYTREFLKVYNSLAEDSCNVTAGRMLLIDPRKETAVQEFWKKYGYTAEL